MTDYCIRAAGQSDAQNWNRYISSISDNPCYLFYEWRFVIEQSCRAKTLLLLAEDKEKKIVGILFSYYLNRPFKAFKILYTPEFGIVSDSSEIYFQLITAANQYCRDWHLSSAVYTTGLASSPQALSAEKQWVKQAFILTLGDTADAFWSGLSSNSRNKIRKSQKAGVKIGMGFDYFESFYKLYVKCYSRKRLNIKSRSFFKALMIRLKDHFDLLVCLYRGKVVSGAFFFKNKTMCSYLYNASDVDFRSLGVNDFLIWEAATYYIHQGLKGINLGESLPGSGAYRFKSKQLKCSPKAVHYLSYCHHDAMMDNRFFQFLDKLYEKFIIVLCRQSFLPNFFIRNLLMKRSLLGRFF